MIEDSNPYGALQCSLYAQAQSGSPQPHGPHSPSAKARLQESCCLGQARELSMNEATNTSVNNLY